jgi:hypothetical protein
MIRGRWFLSVTGLLVLSGTAFPSPQSDDSPGDVRITIHDHISADERTLTAALEWLAGEQAPDGGWSFVYEPNAPTPRRANPGTLKNARNLATAMALLPLVEAGHTHLTRDGKFTTNIKQGMRFLLHNAKRKPLGLSFEDTDSGPFAHALATLVLCEIYARTRDKDLQGPVQSAADYIAATQDRSTGGWRHHPDMRPGVMLATWNVLTLKSAHLAYLKVDPAMVVRADKFIRSLQAKEGAAFGMTKPGDDPAATAAGLLCRMLMGLKRDDPVGVAGLKRLDAAGPAKHDLVHNLFATILLGKAGGHEWNRWVKRLREPLVDAQVKGGRDHGSWHFPKSRGGKWGGRLYSTVMAALMLEDYPAYPSVFGGYWRAPQEPEDFPL